MEILASDEILQRICHLLEALVPVSPVVRPSCNKFTILVAVLPYDGSYQRPTPALYVSVFLQSGSGQTTPICVGVTCGSGISIVRVEEIKGPR